MFEFSEKQINIFIFVVSITFLISSVGTLLNYGSVDFFSQVFQVLISLQILSVFFGVKIKNHNFGSKPIAKYVSLILLLVSGLVSASFITSVVTFGFNDPVILYQILSPIIIISILIIVIPIHVKLARKSF